MKTITRTPNRLFTNFKPDCITELAINKFHFCIYNETISLPRFVTRMLYYGHKKGKLLAKYLLKASLSKDETAPYYLVGNDVKKR